MKNITNKQSTKFNKEIYEFLVAAGYSHEYDGDWRYEFKKDTKYGPHTITLFPQTGSPIWSIFTCFEYPNLAKECFDCNPYTGKYNFHYKKEHEEDIKVDFMDFIDEISPNTIH